MGRLLMLVVVVAALVAVAFFLLQGQLSATRRREQIRGRVKQVTDLAYLHDEISSGLAGAVIQRTKGLGSDTSIHELEAALDDVLAIARAHRAEEPDLATIVIDTVRSE